MALVGARYCLVKEKGVSIFSGTYAPKRMAVVWVIPFSQIVGTWNFLAATILGKMPAFSKELFPKPDLE